MLQYEMILMEKRHSYIKCLLFFRRGSIFDLLNTPAGANLSISAPGSRRGSRPNISIEQEPDPESYGKHLL